MPVTRLVCEGALQSPDVRVLSRILSGLCAVQPFGSRWGMRDRVIGMRSVGGPGAYAMVDGDFRLATEVREVPQDWSQGGDHLGWSWERKEIENYLLDPVVVLRAHPNPPANYAELIERAADRISAYQAARMALAFSPTRGLRLVSRFGRERGKHNHAFPDDPSEATCRQEVKRILREYASQQEANLEDVLDRYQKYLVQCAPPGERRRQFLTFYAGKDLLWAMDQEIGGAAVFLEYILAGIANEPEPVHEWLPEWAALRSVVAAVP